MRDTSAIDRLVAENLPAALRFAIRLTGNRDDGEELIAEALLRVARQWTTLREASAFRAWLYAIVVNAFRDRLRRPRLAAETIGEEHCQLQDWRTSQPDHDVMAAELGERIAAEISRLPPRQREVLVLVAFEHFSVSEVARMIDISEQNAHATLSAARTRLKQRLAPYLGLAEK